MVEKVAWSPNRPRIEHRKCAECGVVKPLNKECFEPKLNRKSGFRGICIKCRKKPNHE